MYATPQNAKIAHGFILILFFDAIGFALAVNFDGADRHVDPVDGGSQANLGPTLKELGHQIFTTNPATASCLYPKIKRLEGLRHVVFYGLRSHRLTAEWAGAHLPKIFSSVR